jgi:hypothetical protein
MPSVPSNAVLAELEAVTRDYARFAGDAAGWSAIIGGSLALASMWIGAGFDSSPTARGVVIAIPVLWLLLKQLAVAWYQRCGRVQPTTDAVALGTRRWLLIGVTAIVIVVAGGKMASVDSSIDTDTVVYLAGVLAIPVIAWRFLRTPLDLAIGTFLLCQAVLASSGADLRFSGVAWIFVPAAALMIAYGVRDHFRFRILQQRIAALRRDIGTVT